MVVRLQMLPDEVKCQVETIKEALKNPGTVWTQHITNVSSVQTKCIHTISNTFCNGSKSFMLFGVLAMLVTCEVTQWVSTRGSRNTGGRK